MLLIRWRYLGFGGLAVLGALIVGLAVARQLRPPTADADDPALVAKGKAVYAGHCASCHGRELQGQPLWQVRDAYYGRRAPAHDASGHTWQHSDADLVAMTRDGRFPGTPGDHVSAMPAFAGRLSDDEILAVIAFIKARWPVSLRAMQARLNPGQAGMPWGAVGDWTLPADCGPMRGHRRPG